MHPSIHPSIDCSLAHLINRNLDRSIALVFTTAGAVVTTVAAAEAAAPAAAFVLISSWFMMVSDWFILVSDWFLTGGEDHYEDHG